jgi:quinoprotein glucose dehydrogenase
VRYGAVTVTGPVTSAALWDLARDSRERIMRYGILIVVGGLAVLGAHSIAQNLTSAGTSWTRPDADPGGTRYSTLTQINTSNVKDLTRAWTFHTNSGRFAGAPMVVDNVMYFSAPNGVYALDATTGALLWRYPAMPPPSAVAAPAETVAAPAPARGIAPDAGRGATPAAPAGGAGGGGGGGFATVGSALFGEGRGARGLGRGGADAAGTATRGPTYWEGTNGVPPRIFSLLSGGLAALDAKTGAIVRTFGENGFLPEITNQSPPVIFQTMLITKGPTEPGKGVTVKGFDIVSGQPRWTFYTKAQVGDPNRASWLAGSAETEASPNIWGIFSVDEQRGLVFVPIERAEGNGNTDYFGGGTPGNSLYSDSLVALDAMTGKMRWYQQLLHHDIWDYDVAAAPVLVEVRRNGRVIPAVAETTKFGLMFIFNRETGEPIFGMEERPVPQTTLPGEWTSATQPLPTQARPAVAEFVQEDGPRDRDAGAPGVLSELVGLEQATRHGPLHAMAAWREHPCVSGRPGRK